MRRPIKKGWEGTDSAGSVAGSPGKAADPQYPDNTLIFDPTIPISAGNVLKTWAEVDALVLASPAVTEIVFIGNCTIPSGGPYVVSRTVWCGDNTGLSNVTIADGATFTGAPLGYKGAVTVANDGAASPFGGAGGFGVIAAEANCVLKSNAGKADLYAFTAGAFVYGYLGSGATLGNGTDAVLSVDGTCTINLFPLGGPSSIKDVSIAGPAGAVLNIDVNWPGLQLGDLSTSFLGTIGGAGASGEGAKRVSVDDTTLPYDLAGSDHVQAALEALGNGKLERIRFDELAGAPASPNEAEFWWDDDEKCIAYQTDQAGVINQVGQEVQFRVVNKTGVQINNGTLVYVNGVQGNRPTVTKAIANGSVTPDVVIGMATHDIANDANGIVTTFGIVRDLNTNAFTEGDKLYLDPSTAGAFTKTKPKFPDQIALIGYVTVKSIDEGEVFINIEFDKEEEQNLPIVSTNPTTGNLWALAHRIQIVTAQAISDVAPYVSGLDYHNDEAVINVTALSAALTMRITGNSVSEATGAITAADTEDIVISATGWYRSIKKWIDKPTFSILTASQNLTADIYRARYWDCNNNNFRVTGFRWEFKPNAAAWSFEFWIYRLETDGQLTTLENKAFANTDPNLWAGNGEKGTFKKTDLTHDFEGSGLEGLIVRINTTNINYLYGDIKYALTPA